ncbi:MAG: hypothetical protein GC192_00410 [Bacteroidetes bacterium]|nr:hypothetical protein [Bacteroidota bacterium]
MKNLRFPLTLTLFAALTVMACKKTKDDYSTELGLEYFPLEIGKFMEYEVDSTIFDPNGDTSVFYSRTFVKEEIIDTLSDNNGNVLYKIEHFERTADTLPWVIKKVLSVSIQENQAIRTEDNLRFIKLTFPVKKNANWDGNIHFDEGLIVTVAGETLEMFKGWKYRIRQVDEPLSIGNFQFDETATVEEADNENLIELRKSSAIYAKGIGLVYRELWILDTQCIDNCIGQTWEEKAEKGFILKQTILNHN